MTILRAAVNLEHTEPTRSIWFPLNDSTERQYNRDRPGEGAAVLFVSTTMLACPVAFTGDKGRRTRENRGIIGLYAPTPALRGSRGELSRGVERRIACEQTADLNCQHQSLTTQHQRWSSPDAYTPISLPLSGLIGYHNRGFSSQRVELMPSGSTCGCVLRDPLTEGRKFFRIALTTSWELIRLLRRTIRLVCYRRVHQGVNVAAGHIHTST